jgi:NAD(P)-dependent dehydrogenase (short-subunit alcohol dehydrogenase family)
MGKLEGKVAVITGGSSPMALASAKRFVEEGADVFITGRRQEALDEAVKLIWPERDRRARRRGQFRRSRRMFDTVGEGLAFEKSAWENMMVINWSFFVQSIVRYWVALMKI